VAKIELFVEDLGMLTPPTKSVTGKVPATTVLVPIFRFGLPIGPRVLMTVDRQTAWRLKIGSVMLPVVALLVLPIGVMSLIVMMIMNLPHQVSSNPAIMASLLGVFVVVGLACACIPILHVPQRPHIAPNNAIHISEVDVIAARAWAAQEPGRVRLLD